MLVFIHLDIFFLQQTYKPSDLRILIIDPKQVTYNAFQNSSHLLNNIICSKAAMMKVTCKTNH